MTIFITIILNLIEKLISSLCIKIRNIAGTRNMKIIYFFLLNFFKIDLEPRKNPVREYINEDKRGFIEPICL